MWPVSFATCLYWSTRYNGAVQGDGTRIQQPTGLLKSQGTGSFCHDLQTHGDWYNTHSQPRQCQWLPMTKGVSCCGHLPTTEWTYAGRWSSCRREKMFHAPTQKGSHSLEPKCCRIAGDTSVPHQVKSPTSLLPLARWRFRLLQGWGSCVLSPITFSLPKWFPACWRTACRAGCSSTWCPGYFHLHKQKCSMRFNYSILSMWLELLLLSLCYNGRECRQFRKQKRPVVQSAEVIFFSALFVDFWIGLKFIH